MAMSTMKFDQPSLLNPNIPCIIKSKYQQINASFQKWIFPLPIKKQKIKAIIKIIAKAIGNPNSIYNTALN